MQYGNRERDRGEWRRGGREGGYPSERERGEWSSSREGWGGSMESQREGGGWQGRSDDDYGRSDYGRGDSGRSDYGRGDSGRSDYGRGREQQRGGWGGYEDSGRWNRESESSSYGYGDSGRGGERFRQESRGAYGGSYGVPTTGYGYGDDFDSERGTWNRSSERQGDRSSSGGMGSTSFGSQSRGGGFGLEQGRDRYGANFMGSWGGAEWGVDYGAGIHAGAARNRSYEGRSGGRSGTLDRDRPNHRGKGPKGYKRNDERIKEDVSEALQNDYDVDASNIEVEVNDGEVTLRGEVQSRQEKRAAEDCAEDVAGVKDVTNQLRVRASSGRGMGDDSERESERSSNVPYNRSTAGSTTSGTSSTSSSRSGTSTSTSDRAGSTKNT